ncbi:MAG TPA: GNAT family protein [Caulobacteraceae bacterium]
MSNAAPPSDAYLARGEGVAVRRVLEPDLRHIATFAFTVSIVERLTDLARLTAAFEADGLWKDDSGAVAVEEVATRRLVGTCQFYRSGPCIHGYELGYIIHQPTDRRRGFGSEAVRLFSDHLFAAIPGFFRQQLMIEVWNTPSWKLAEGCGFVREGLLRSSGLGAGDPSDCFVYARTRKDWREQLHTTISLGGTGVGG